MWYNEIHPAERRPFFVCIEVKSVRRKLYGNAIQPCCEYCSRARRATDGRVMLCPRRGVVPLYMHCRRFVYDPLKRVPYRQPALEKFQPEDFTL